MSFAMTFRSGTACGIAALALGLIGLSPAMADRKAVPTTVSINGSSTLLPFTQAAIRNFAATARAKGTAFTAKATGTSAGLREFCSGGSSLAAASRPINSSELKSCDGRGVRFLELPVAYDAITVVVSQQNSWAKQITIAELQRLWNREAQGRILRWNQVNAQWPDKTISLCGPGPDSGTFDSFNKAINGSEENGRRDITASEDDNVLVRCVAGNPLAMGYFGYDYYQANQKSLRALAVTGNRGAVLPSPQSVQQSRYLPLSRPLFLYVNEQALRNQPVLRNFINATLQNGGRLARQAGVIPFKTRPIGW